MKQFKFLVEELHRGEWTPLLNTSKKTGEKTQKRVFITKDEAEIMNRNKNAYRRRYILAEDQKPTAKKDTAKKEATSGKAKSASAPTFTELELEELRNAYSEKFGKQPHPQMGGIKLTEKINE